MHYIIRIILALLAVLTMLDTSFAQAQKPKYTTDEVYAFFAQYSPKDVVEHTKKAVEYYRNVAMKAKGLPQEQEEAIFLDALKEFHNDFSKWPLSRFPLMFFSIPQRCDQGRVIAHYIPEFFQFSRNEGFTKRYKDIDGKKVGIILCQGVRNHPDGIWVTQYQWWPETDKPLKMGFLLMPIPDTPYEIEGFYPTKEYTEEELNISIQK